MYKEFNVNKISYFVKTEYHAETTWFGKTKKLWVKFDQDPRSLPLERLRYHVIQCFEKSEDDLGPRPEGYISAVVIVK